MFNLKAFQSGKPCFTGEGFRAEFICVLSDHRIPARLVVDIWYNADYPDPDPEDGAPEEVEYDVRTVSYYLNGKFLGTGDHPMDLMVSDYDDVDEDYATEQVWLEPTVPLKICANSAKYEGDKKRIAALLQVYGWTMDKSSAYYYDKEIEASEVRRMMGDLLAPVNFQSAKK